MSSHYSQSGHSSNCAFGSGKRCKGHWSGANIAAMVLGFIIFPPLGLIVLVWTLTGHPIQDLPGWVKGKWQQFFGSESTGRRSGGRTFDESGNVIFDEYQQTQHDRIREIKEEIKRRTDAFRHFRQNAQRRKDQDEFDLFMSSNPDKQDKSAE